MRTKSAQLCNFGCATAVGLVVSFGAIAPAHASLVGDTVAVQLLSPNGAVGLPDPVDLSDSVTVQTAPPAEIAAGAGTNIGGYMLPGEFIDIGASSIVIRLFQGAGGTPGKTGYADGASYIFTDLGIAGDSFALGQVGAVGISNVSALNAASWIKMVNSRSLQIFIDDIEFVDLGLGESQNNGTITINLETDGNVAPVPEPSAWLLLGAGLAGLGLMRRRRDASTTAC